MDYISSEIKEFFHIILVFLFLFFLVSLTFVTIYIIKFAKLKILGYSGKAKKWYTYAVFRKNDDEFNTIEIEALFSDFESAKKYVEERIKKPHYLELLQPELFIEEREVLLLPAKKRKK